MGGNSSASAAKIKADEIRQLDNEDRSSRDSSRIRRYSGNGIESRRYSGSGSESQRYSGSGSEPSLHESVHRARIVEARPVQGGESELPFVYAEFTPIGIKHFLKERPIWGLICFAVVFFVAGIVSLILYLTVFKAPETVLVTNAPTITPSQSPTFLSDDMVAAASILSGDEVFGDPSSPQFRAVGWMSIIARLNKF